MNDSVISHALRGLIKFVSTTRLYVDELYKSSEDAKAHRDELDERVTANAHALTDLESANVVELKADIEEIQSSICVVDDRVDEALSAVESFDCEDCDSFNDLKAGVEGLESRVESLEGCYASCHTEVKSNAEELSLQEHRLGSLETKLEEHKANTIANHADLSTDIGAVDDGLDALKLKLDGEIVSIVDLATRLNRLEQRTAFHVTNGDIETQITDAIHKLYEMHGMEMDFGCCLAAKGGDDE